MPRETSAQLLAEGISFAIIVSRFNSFISSKLLEGAVDAITRHGGSPDEIHVVWVPGAWEIPLVAQRLARSESCDAVICLGAVIRGSTPHFDVVVSESAKGIASAMMDTGIPVLNGILTTDSIEQAVERAGTKMGNKGAEAAVAAIEMANLMKMLPAE